MPINASADQVLSQVLSDRYRGKTILDNSGIPFTVSHARVFNDSPDPGWTITFVGLGYGSGPSRFIYMDEALPEVWPYDVPVSPAS